jgi:hypothetical protein
MPKLTGERYREINAPTLGEVREFRVLRRSYRCRDSYRSLMSVSGDTVK